MQPAFSGENINYTPSELPIDCLQYQQLALIVPETNNKYTETCSYQAPSPSPIHEDGQTNLSTGVLTNKAHSMN